jgi:hypothetical protein
MQDVGSKEDTELGRKALALSWRELPVESLDTVSLLAMDVFREGS